MEKLKINPKILFVLATMLWGFNYQWSKMLVAETHAFEAALWRYGFAFLTLFLLCFGKLPTKAELKSHWKGAFLVGFVGLFLFNFFFFQGMKLTTPINAVLIIGLNPAFTLILSGLILGTKISLRQIIGMLIALFGVFYLLFKGDVSQFLELKLATGDSLVLLSGIFFALHHVFVKKYSVGMGNTPFSLYAAFWCLLPFILLNLVLNTFEPQAYSFGDLSNYTWRFWMAVIGIGVFGTGFGYWFWYIAVKEKSAAYGASFINIVPLSGSLFSFLWGNQFYLFHLYSAIIILSGVFVMQYKKDNQSFD